MLFEFREGRMCTICMCTKTEFGINDIIVSYGGRHWKAKYHSGSKELGPKSYVPFVLIWKLAIFSRTQSYIWAGRSYSG